MKEMTPSRGRRLAPAQDVPAEFSYVSEPETVSLLEYWNVLVKRRRIIIVLFAIIFGTGAYFALTATPLYTASSIVKIEPQNPQVTGLSELQPIELRGEYDYYQTQFALLQTRRVAARVVTELGLESNKGFTEAEVFSPNPVDHAKSWVSRTFGYVSSVVSPLFRSPQNQSVSPTGIPTFGAAEIELSVPYRLIDKYLGFISISPVKQTRLVRIEFTTPGPELSQVLANAHVESFMRMSLESRFGLTKEAREFLDQKKIELRDRLEKSEAAINQFRRVHGVLSVEKGENIVVDRLVDLNKQLTVARALRIESESLYRTVENRNNHDLADIMRQGLVQQLKGNIATLEAEKARMGTVFKPDHPKIQDLNQQLNAARQALSSEISTIVRGIRSGYTAALAKERALQSETEKQQQDALRLKEVGVDYTILQEEVNANRSLYESVLKRLTETNVSKDLAVSNMQIAEKAAKPQRASAPNVSLYLFVSMISGLLLGVGTAFVQEFFNSTLATPDEVWRAVGLGTLGVVPHLRSPNARSRTSSIKRLVGRREPGHMLTGNQEGAEELIISHTPVPIMSESYRAIRTSLLLSHAERPPQVILLTSPSPGEGKTLTSTNLAIAVAHDGHSVLLIDGDLRRGRCHVHLGLSSVRGLADILSGELDVEDSIQPTAIHGLNFLPRGTPPPNPSELLGSQSMKDLLKRLKEKFEFIIIDSPPVIALSDAAVLSVLSDGVLLIFDGQKTSTAYAQRAVERLEMVKARLVGVVLNGVNLDNPHYSYYHDYNSYYPLHSKNDEVKRAAAHAAYELNGTVRNGKSHREENGKVVTNNDAWVQQNRRKNGKSLNVGSSSVVKDVDEFVSPEFMDRLLDAMVEAAGPMAPLILQDHIALLGESHNAFPKNRVAELVDLIAPEILHPESRAHFQTKISEDIRNFAHD